MPFTTSLTPVLRLVTAITLPLASLGLPTAFLAVTVTPAVGMTLATNIGSTLQGPPGEDGTDGTNGTDGDDGLSAYQLALAGGFVGSQAAWLGSLNGLPGADGVDGTNGTNGTDGTDGTNGLNGNDGLSAYQVAVADGYGGSQSDWIASLNGTDGTDGTNGTNGTDGTNGVDAVIGGSAQQVQFNSAGALDGASNVEIGPTGNLLLVDNASQPAAPAAGRAQMYSRLRAGASWPEFQRSTGREIPLQAHFGLNRVAWWAPSSGTTVNTNGIPRTAVGTVATPTLASTNLSTSCRRWRVTSAATAPAAADERAAATVCWRGNAAGLGGWTYTNRVSLVTLQSTSVGFFGHSSSTAAFSTTQTIAALTNCIGIGFTNGTDTNWQIIHNDASGAPTRIDTGFPLADLTDVYTLVIYSAPNGSSIWVRIVDEVSGVAFERELTTDIPANTTFLSVRNYLNNGGVAAAVAYDCSGVYLETDY